MGDVHWDVTETTYVVTTKQKDSIPKWTILCKVRWIFFRWFICFYFTRWIYVDISHACTFFFFLFFVFLFLVYLCVLNIVCIARWIGAYLLWMSQSSSFEMPYHRAISSTLIPTHNNNVLQLRIKIHNRKIVPSAHTNNADHANNRNIFFSQQNKIFLHVIQTM